MMMFVIFLIVNVGTIGIFYGVYGTKRKYEEGMLMGVHLPGSAAESEEVKMLMKKYRTWTKWFYTLNLLAGIAVCGFCFWYISVFMIVWSIWLVEVCIGAILLLYRTHRKLYDLKMKNGWIGSNGSKIMTADSAVDATVSGENGNVSVVAYFVLRIDRPAMFITASETIFKRVGRWMDLIFVRICS
mgnify:CR=1 FL=1